MSLTKYDCHKKNQKVLSKKQSYGHENKKTLESELNRICEDKKRQKEYKKQLFNQNIKPHIVYMDENGTIQENLNLHLYNKNNEIVEKRLKQIEKQENRKKTVAIIIFLVFIFYILCYCYEMHTGNVIIF